MQDKENYIAKSCEKLGLTKKDISNIFKVTIRTVDNWANNEDSIPRNTKINIDLLVENKKQKLEIDRLKEISADFIKEFLEQEKERKDLVSDLAIELIR